MLTGSRSSASVNIWTSLLGLNLSGGYNFRTQAYIARNGLNEPESLYFESMVTVSESEGACVLVNKKLASSGSIKTMADAIKNRHQASQDA